MRLFLPVSLAALLLCGAMNLVKLPDSRPASRSLSAPVSPAVAAATPTKIWTNNALLYKGDLLKIHFETPHAEYLGVIDPDGHFFYVVFPVEEGDENTKLKSFVDSRLFVSYKSLSINTSTFTADPYTYGVLENQPVFTKSGTYRFLLGDNLHMDDESMLGVLKITYRHSERPEKPAVKLVNN